MTTVITRGAGSAQALGYAARATAANYIEDVFSTYLYTGTGAAATITNGIDLSTKGGLVWTKRRSGSAVSHALLDTVRGGSSLLTSDDTSAAITAAYITAFNNNGYTYDGGYGRMGTNGENYASWTFRKQAKFFDVVTYTGDGSTGYRMINHSLGSIPGFIIIKPTSTTGDWVTLARQAAGTYVYGMYLNQTVAGVGGWDPVANGWLTSTQFTTYIGNTTAETNTNGVTYVAYLFAHNAGGFGLTGTDNVISCGSFTTSGAGTATVNLGYEPQWLMLKNSTSADNWYVLDNMRGFSMTQGNNLNPNQSAAEGTYWSGGTLIPTSTGFSAPVNIGASQTWIYVAIRRGPMRTPTSGTSVYVPTTFSTSSGSDQTISSPPAIDMGLLVHAPVNGIHYVATRLIGNSATLQTQSTGAQSTTLTAVPTPTNQNAFTSSMAFMIEGSNQTYWNGTATGTNCFYGFCRAPGFFDVVCYTGTGANQTLPHNLGAVPELMITKNRSNASNWRVYDAFNGPTKRGSLNDAQAWDVQSTMWNDTAPTSTVFTVGTSNSASSQTYVAYLFATVAGVSKVGSYTGTGTTKQIDCGFTGGARFVLIKRTDSTGDWYVWDSARGIVAGNDPYLLLNSTAAEVTNTDYVDTYSAGFEISSTAPAAINANGGTFIFLAIA